MLYTQEAGTPTKLLHGNRLHTADFYTQQTSTQSLYKALPSTTLYYKACTKYAAVPLCTTTKACTKHVPVLLCQRNLEELNFRQYGQMESTARKKFKRVESQNGEDKRWRRSEMEKVRREKMQVRERYESCETLCFFQCFVASEG